MASQRRSRSNAVRNAVNGAPKDLDSGVVELDASFGRMSGLTDGQMVRLSSKWYHHLAELFLVYRSASYYTSTHR